MPTVTVNLRLTTHFVWTPRKHFAAREKLPAIIRQRLYFVKDFKMGVVRLTGPADSGILLNVEKVYVRERNNANQGNCETGHRHC